MKAVQLKQVSFAYNKFDDKVLNNVNFFINYGEITLLSGVSGQGKSTLISIISGIIPNITNGMLTGEVLIDGKSIIGQRLATICKKVGIVTQNPDNQIIHNIVEDEIAFGCENFAIEPSKILDRIENVCAIVELDKTAKTRSLSGGQKQRLITASTLATGQKILILDEPLANLDFKSAKLLMETLELLAKAGYAILVVEHRLDIVLPFANCVWDIKNGSVNKVENKLDYLQSQTKGIDYNCNFKSISNIILRLQNVSYKVKNKQILDEINFDIYNGERILLLGENGCGKTTLLRLIVKLIKPSKGVIERIVNEQNLKKIDRNWFKTIGIVYQNPNYQLFMQTVEKEIEYGAINKEYANYIIDIFGLEHLRKRHPQSLSEGQKRKVSIASVLAGKPKVLLLDEPTVGQDYDSLCDLVNILGDLHNQTGNTMITITHDKRCAEALCDRAILIENGKIKEEGDKQFVRKYFMNLQI